MILPGHCITRLFLLDFGSFDVGPGKRRIGIPGYLLQTDKGANILVDTGFDPAYATDYAATDARDRLSDFGHLIDFSIAQTAEGQLGLLGLRPFDITHLILTHGHIDHVGSLPLFTCPILLTKAERSTPRPIYWQASQPIAWPTAPYIQISDETPVCSGLHLIPTPGHTPGHLSLLVSIGARSLILAADAINRASEPAEGFPDAMDPITAAASARRLFDLQRLLAADMIWGHDPAQWQTLPRAPTPFVQA
jgi:N-acyl homoserine lactone hydrolase